MWSQLRFIQITIILTYSCFDLKSGTVWMFASTDLDTTIIPFWFPNFDIPLENLSFQLMSMFTHLLVYHQYNLVLIVNLSNYQLVKIDRIIIRTSNFRRFMILSLTFANKNSIHSQIYSVIRRGYMLGRNMSFGVHNTIISYLWVRLKVNLTLRIIVNIPSIYMQNIVNETLL